MDGHGSHCGWPGACDEPASDLGISIDVIVSTVWSGCHNA